MVGLVPTCCGVQGGAQVGCSTLTEAPARLSTCGPSPPHTHTNTTRAARPAPLQACCCGATHTRQVAPEHSAAGVPPGTIHVPACGAVPRWGAPTQSRSSPAPRPSTHHYHHNTPRCLAPTHRHARSSDQSSQLYPAPTRRGWSWHDVLSSATQIKRDGVPGGTPPATCENPRKPPTHPPTAHTPLTYQQQQQPTRVQAPTTPAPHRQCHTLQLQLLLHTPHERRLGGRFRGVGPGAHLCDSSVPCCACWAPADAVPAVSALTMQLPQLAPGGGSMDGHVLQGV
jgi:hypothetical protein